LSDILIPCESLAKRPEWAPIITWSGNNENKVMEEILLEILKEQKESKEGMTNSQRSKQR
jgi:hypothetical protein